MKYVVIGGGLAGLSLVHWLHKNHHEVVLLEASERLGGRFRGSEVDSSELGYIPYSDEAVATLEWLRGLSPLPFAWNEVDAQPLHFEGNEWRPFLGFADFPSNVVDELTYLTQPKHFRLEPGFEQLTRALIEQLPVEARTVSEVTGFQIENGKIRAAVINAQEAIEGDEFLFCPSLHLLNRLIPNDAIKPGNRTRIAKMTAWTSVSLTLIHKQPIATSPALRFVLGTGREFEPVVGRIAPSHSIWTNLVSNDYAEDLEHTGNCVRYIRRTIKRVFPEVLEQAAEEKIKVRVHAAGKIDLKLKSGLAFPELPNLHIIDPRLSTIPGDLSTAAIARQWLESTRLLVAQPGNPVLSDSNAVAESV